MMQLNNEAMELMKQDSLNSYPFECCGFLFGHEVGDERTATSILVVTNISEEDQRRRFRISAQEYMHAENYALEKNLTLLGIYHSHPDHPAIPSEHDRLAAQPFFSYIILSISDLGVSGLRSWRLNDQQQFEEEPINHIINTKNQQPTWQPSSFRPH